MTGTEISAIIVGLGTFVGAVALALRGITGDRFQRKVTESASLLSGYTEMVKNLRAEIADIRQDNDSEIQRLQQQHQRELEQQNLLHEQERQRWNAERNRLEERLETLEAQVVALMNRPKSLRERKSDQ